jgi:hypothetical protein
MGGGNYSHVAHKALLRSRSNIPVQQVFQQQKCHPLMDPKGVKLRESRDSDNHPQSLGIVFALDVTGSMGAIPRLLATEQLPDFMKILMDCEVKDPQLLFMAVGDAISDNAPLQVGQFESTAELMDQWLTWCYLEGGGGGTGQESYEMGMYFLAMHTEMDCMVKRNKRGYLFMTGDEEPYSLLSKNIVDGYIGDKLDDDVPVEAIVAELQKSFIPFFIIPDKARAQRCERTWRNLLGDNVIVLEGPSDVCYAAAGALLLNEGLAKDMKDLEKKLLSAGLDKRRKDTLIHALKPFAEVVFHHRTQR